MGYVVAYLAAIVAANLLIAHFGPEAAPIVAFALIGLDITCRDHLHDRWRNDYLVAKMGSLIAAGGLISWLLNPNAGRVALASVVAFLGAGGTDAVVYHRLYERGWSRFARVNGSNVVAATVDSLLFFLVAFGGLHGWNVVAQIAAKAGGGAVWAVILFRSPVSHWIDVLDAEDSSS